MLASSREARGNAEPGSEVADRLGEWESDGEALIKQIRHAVDTLTQRMDQGESVGALRNDIVDLADLWSELVQGEGEVFAMAEELAPSMQGRGDMITMRDRTNRLVLAGSRAVAQLMHASSA